MNRHALCRAAEREAARLLGAEVTHPAIDARRILSSERCALVAAIQRGTVTREKIDEAARVREMWSRVS